MNYSSHSLSSVREGGQRKRVNIGMETVTQPSLLFLDEPTSGLDATSSYTTIDLVCRLAREKRCTTIAVRPPLTA